MKRNAETCSKAPTRPFHRLMVAGLALAMAFAMVLCWGCSAPVENSANANTAGDAEEGAGEAVELQVFAANSLSKAMEEVQELYTAENPNITFADTQYEGSGTLNEMLSAGSYADLLITASTGTMNTAVDNGTVDEATVESLFTNDLVIVTGKDNPSVPAEGFTLEDLATGSYTLAVGDANVPAGNYAKQSLTTTTPPCWISADGTVGPACAGTDGTFDGTPLAGKVTEGSSVGNVCNYANSGDVDVAIVYSSDVYRFGNVSIVSVISEDTHKPIVYPAAICTDSQHPEETAAFLEFCATDSRALEIWQKWGFEMAA